MNTNTRSSIIRRSWRVAVSAAVLVLAAGVGSASAATDRTPSAPTPGTAVQRMVKDCRDAMRSGTAGTTPMLGSTGTNMMGGTDSGGVTGRF